MWENITQIYHKRKQWAIDEITNLLTEFESSKEDMDKYLKQMESVTFHFLQSSIKEKASNIDLLMNQKFNLLFNTDKSGIPKSWKPGDDINKEWKNAKHECEQLLDLFGRMRLSDKDFNSTYFEFDPETPVIKSREIELQNKDFIIITRTEGERYLQRFRDYSNTAYTFAQKEMEHAEVKGQIPFYFLVLLFILGWNELLWLVEMIIFNPFLLLFMILLACIALIIVKLNLLPVLYPALRMFIYQIRDYLRYKLNQIEQKVPLNIANKDPKNKTE